MYVQKRLFKNFAWVVLDSKLPCHKQHVMIKPIKRKIGEKAIGRAWLPPQN